MANLLNIYNRPKDDSSDDDSVDGQRMNSSDQQSPSTLPSNTMNVQKNMDSNVPRKGGHIPKYVPIPTQKGQSFTMKIDYAVFNGKGMNCQSGHSIGGGIVSGCSSLRRLIEGLKCYDALKRDPDSLMGFIANQYRVKMIDDFNHFTVDHEHQSKEIMDEMIAVHHFKPCDVGHCAHSKRHFDATQRVSPCPSKHSQIVDDDYSTSKLYPFYSSKYDALHFALFHLFDTGYRFRVPRRQKKDDNEADDETVAQQELAAAVSSINTGRDRCRRALGRFKSESNNKFNLSVGVGAESKTEDGHSVKTTTDSMMEYAASNGVGHDALVQINGFMVREDIDTDAAKDDVADSKEESNIFVVVKNHDTFRVVKRYFTLSAGVHFDTLFHA